VEIIFYVNFLLAIEIGSDFKGKTYLLCVMISFLHLEHTLHSMPYAYAVNTNRTVTINTSYNLCMCMRELEMLRISEGTKSTGVSNNRSW